MQTRESVVIRSCKINCCHDKVTSNIQFTLVHLSSIFWISVSVLPRVSGTTIIMKTMPPTQKPENSQNVVPIPRRWNIRKAVLDTTKDNRKLTVDAIEEANPAE